MGEDVVDVTVHIDEELGHARLQEIAEGVRALAGIASASFHDDKPHFLIVKYDPNRTDSASIHRALTAQGVHTELLGI